MNGFLSRKPTSKSARRTQRAKEATTEQSSEWVMEPELSWTDRRGGHYQASVTEVILRAESL